MTDVEDEVGTFTFAELSDRAKDKVRDEFRATHLDHDWWDATYEDAVRMGGLMGLHVGVHQYAVQRGNAPAKMYTKPDIWFSGFFSQGDGCCWSGSIHAEDLAGAVGRITAECGGTDEDLIELASVAEQLHVEIATVIAVQRLLPPGEDPDWPDVARNMHIGVVGSERGYRTDVSDGDIPVEVSNTAAALVEGFADWIYKQLESEYDYQMSDEVIDEAITQYEHTYDEGGNAQ